MRKAILFFTVMILGVSACERPENYGIRFEEPNVLVTFVNKDSTNALNGLISNIDSTIHYLDSVKADSREIERLQVQKDAFELIQSTINKGWFRLDTLTDLTTGNYLIFEDSAKGFRLPLSMHMNGVLLELNIGGIKDTLWLEYDRRNYRFEEGVGVEAFNLELISRDWQVFQKVVLSSCKEEECKTNEQKITITY